jgi:hypothetical protein
LGISKLIGSSSSPQLESLQRWAYGKALPSYIGEKKREKKTGQVLFVGSHNIKANDLTTTKIMAMRGSYSGLQTWI